MNGTPSLNRFVTIGGVDIPVTAISMTFAPGRFPQRRCALIAEPDGFHVSAYGPTWRVAWKGFSEVLRFDMRCRRESPEAQLWLSCIRGK